MTTATTKAIVTPATQMTYHDRMARRSDAILKLDNRITDAILEAVKSGVLSNSEIRTLVRVASDCLLNVNVTD